MFMEMSFRAVKGCCTPTNENSLVELTLLRLLRSLTDDTINEVIAAYLWCRRFCGTVVSVQFGMMTHTRCVINLMVIVD